MRAVNERKHKTNVLNRMISGDFFENSILPATQLQTTAAAIGITKSEDDDCGFIVRFGKTKAKMLSDAAKIKSKAMAEF